MIDETTYVDPPQTVLDGAARHAADPSEPTERQMAWDVWKIVLAQRAADKGGWCLPWVRQQVREFIAAFAEQRHTDKASTGNGDGLAGRAVPPASDVPLAVR